MHKPPMMTPGQPLLEQQPSLWPNPQPELLPCSLTLRQPLQKQQPSLWPSPQPGVLPPGLMPGKVLFLKKNVLSQALLMRKPQPVSAKQTLLPLLPTVRISEKRLSNTLQLQINFS